MSTYRERITGLQWPVYYEDVETLRRIGFEDAKELAAEIAAEADAALAERDALIERLATVAGRMVDRNFTFFDGGMVGADRKITRQEVLDVREAIATYHQQRTAQEGATNA